MEIWLSHEIMKTFAFLVSETDTVPGVARVNQPSPLGEGNPSRDLRSNPFVQHLQ